MPLPRNRATLVGFIAVLLWSLLAVLTVATAPVPPFLLNALTFAVGGGIGLIWILATGTAGRLRHVDWRVYAFGTAGLFGYHALYFSALRLAPPAEAGLVAYLWPVLIVLFSGLLPGERLRAGHIAGVLLAFGGAVQILSRGTGRGIEGAEAGLFLAFLAALTWAGYSVISRRLLRVPTEAVVVFCLVTAALSVPAHLIWEQTLWPLNAAGWVACLALGLGPVGLAFYVWDIGVKWGNIQLLGVASYAAPLLSTLALVLAGAAEASWTLMTAAVLIAGGAVIAARAGARGVSPDQAA